MPLMSTPRYLRPKDAAASAAVPHPQNGSSTKSPGLDDALMMRSNNASGF